MLINQKTLGDALALAMPFIPARPSHAVLGSFLMQSIKDDSIKITAFDLATQFQIVIPSENVQLPDDGIAVPAKILNDLVKTLPNESLFFSLNNNNSSLVIEFSSGTFTIPYLLGADFPVLPSKSDAGISVPREGFVNALNSVVYACANDETRQVLTGIRIARNATGNLEFAATDGHRLAVCTTGFSVDSGLEMTIPSAAIRTLGDFRCETLELMLDEDYLYINAGDINVICRPILGAYPPYQGLIPTQFAGTAAFSQRQMLGALRRAAAMLGKESSLITLAISESSIEIQTSVESKESYESIDCVTTGQITGNSYSFALPYLIDAIRSISTPDVVFNANSSAQPVVIFPTESNSQLALIMPIRVV